MRKWTQGLRSKAHALFSTDRRWTTNLKTAVPLCVGRVLIAWFNDWVLFLFGQIANLMIAIFNPILYNSIHSEILLIARKTRNSRISQSKSDLLNPSPRPHLVGSLLVKLLERAAVRIWT